MIETKIVRKLSRGDRTSFKLKSYRSQDAARREQFIYVNIWERWVASVSEADLSLLLKLHVARWVAHYEHSEACHKLYLHSFVMQILKHEHRETSSIPRAAWDRIVSFTENPDTKDSILGLMELEAESRVKEIVKPIDWWGYNTPHWVTGKRSVHDCEIQARMEPLDRRHARSGGNLKAQFHGDLPRVQSIRKGGVRSR